jgi:hypothetical protein
MDCFAGLILVRLGHSPAEDSSAGATKLKSFEGGVLKELEDLSTRHKSYDQICDPPKDYPRTPMGFAARRRERSPTPRKRASGVACVPFVSLSDFEHSITISRLAHYGGWGYINA